MRKLRQKERRYNLAQGVQPSRDSQDSNPNWLQNRGFASQLTPTDRSTSSRSLLTSYQPDFYKWSSSYPGLGRNKGKAFCGQDLDFTQPCPRCKAFIHSRCRHLLVMCTGCVHLFPLIILPSGKKINPISWKSFSLWAASLTSGGAGNHH